MTAKAILNNYQIGSYTYKVLSAKITKTDRIDKSHTLVVWSELTQSDIRLLQKVIRKLEIVEE